MFKTPEPDEHETEAVGGPSAEEINNLFGDTPEREETRDRWAATAPICSECDSIDIVLITPNDHQCFWRCKHCGHAGECTI